MKTYTTTIKNFMTDARECRTFTAPDAGGYVREILDSGEHVQVSIELTHRGVRLYLGASEDLAMVIHRAQRTVARAWRHELNR